MSRMIDRAQIVANVLASQRLEGLDPGPETRAVLDAWARGELSTEDLRRERAQLADALTQAAPASIAS